MIFLTKKLLTNIFSVDICVEYVSSTVDSNAHIGAPDGIFLINVHTFKNELRVQLEQISNNHITIHGVTTYKNILPCHIPQIVTHVIKNLLVKDFTSMDRPLSLNNGNIKIFGSPRPF